MRERKQKIGMRKRERGDKDTERMKMRARERGERGREGIEKGRIV
jgi:hypothetical protein